MYVQVILAGDSAVIVGTFLNITYRVRQGMQILDVRLLGFFLKRVKMLYCLEKVVKLVVCVLTARKSI